MIAPVLLLLLIGTVDFGTAIYDRFALNGAVSAAADYAILNASSVNSTQGQSLA
jgi:Flp pilus assembly protein TadG